MLMCSVCTHTHTQKHIMHKLNDIENIWKLHKNCLVKWIMNLIILALNMIMVNRYYMHVMNDINEKKYAYKAWHVVLCILWICLELLRGKTTYFKRVPYMWPRSQIPGTVQGYTARHSIMNAHEHKLKAQIPISTWWYGNHLKPP